MSNNKQVPASFGACLHNFTKQERCAVSPASCVSNEIFRGAYDTPYYQPCNEADLHVSRCASSGRCAPDLNFCLGPEDVIPDRYCTLKHDGLPPSQQAIAIKKHIPIQATTFPACQDTTHNMVRCVLDESHCLEGEMLIHPQAPLARPCLCQDVKVGLCYQKGTSFDDISLSNSHCVAHYKDCNMSSHLYLSSNPRSLLAQTGLDCRLCKPEEEATLIGACVEPDFSATAGEGEQAVYRCAQDATQCHALGNNALFIDSQKLLEDFGLYCPNVNEFAPPPAQSAKPTPPTLAPTIIYPCYDCTHPPTTLRPTPSPVEASTTTMDVPIANGNAYVLPSQDDEGRSAFAVTAMTVGITAVAMLALMAVATSLINRAKYSKAAAKAAEFMNVEEDNVEISDLPSIA